MQIQQARFENYIRYQNPPRLKVLADEIPDWDSLQWHAEEGDMPFGGEASAEQGDFIFYGGNRERSQARMRKTGGVFYWAEDDGYIAYFFHDPNRETGYGSSVFTVPVIGEEEPRRVKGPWSSNPTQSEQMGAPRNLDVSLTDKPDVWERGYTFMAAHISYELFDTWLNEHGRLITMINVAEDGSKDGELVTVPPAEKLPPVWATKETQR
jgi:hypothetical protein